MANSNKAGEPETTNNQKEDDGDDEEEVVAEKDFAPEVKSLRMNLKNKKLSMAVHVESLIKSMVQAENKPKGWKLTEDKMKKLL